MRIRNVKLTVGGIELKCFAQSVDFGPLENVVLCTDDPEHELTATLQLTYGASGTYNQLSALAGTTAVHVVAPLDAAAAAGNPNWTFSATVPAIKKMVASPGEIGTFDYVVQSEGGVVEALS
jgi:hypothetical protein